MNERIKELAEQAKQYARERMAHTMNPMLFSAEVFQEKFAELIIRECAELTLDYKNNDHYNGWLDYRDEIKKHFGVEE